MTIGLRDSTEPELVLAAHVLTRVDAVAREVGVDYLVVGATARTILSVGLVGRPPERATRDIDIAAAVGSWADFERLSDKLEKRGHSPHSFLVEGVEVDVVPYGGIEGADRTILWPDDHRMNVRGLSEAVDSAETVLLPGGAGHPGPLHPSAGSTQAADVVGPSRQHQARRDRPRDDDRLVLVGHVL